ncbi:MAG: HEAT repeat domain-containing protein [Spirochaetes bacterium]|nr:HEAT repeat domain-containing protein [Spirochaetota bacterium]
MSLFSPNIENLEKENNIQEILNYLGHWSSETRFKAFNVLLKNHKNDTTIMEKLKTLVNDKSHKVRTNAILSLTQAGQEKVYDKLKIIMEEGSESDKDEALRILSEHGTTSNPSILNAVVAALHDKKEYIRQKALKTMGYIGNKYFVPYIGEARHEQNAELRLEAVKALSRIGGDEVVEHLIAALMDNDPSVAKAAHNTLTTSKSPKAHKALNDEEYIVLMNEINGLLDHRVHAIRYIGDRQLDDAYPLVLKALADEYKQVRLEALRALRFFPDRPAENLVQKLLSDEYPEVRLEAVRTMKKYQSLESLKAIIPLLDDKNEKVRETAKTIYNDMRLTVKEDTSGLKRVARPKRWM